MTPASPSPSPAWRYLPALLALATLIRVLLSIQPACIDRNGVQFIDFARQLGDDPLRAMRATTRQPGFAWLLLWTHRALGGDSPESWQRAGQLIAILGGVAVCAGVYFLTRQLFDHRTATMAALFAALWPQGAELSAGVLSDMPHLALYLAALVLAIRAADHLTPARLALVGLVLGAAYLIRQDAIGLLAAIALCCLTAAKSIPLKRRFVATAAMLVAFAIAVAPHSLATGHLMPNKNPLDLFRSFFSAIPRPSTLLFAEIIPWWKTPGRTVEEWAKSGRYVFATLLLISIFSRQAPRAAPLARRFVIAAILLQLLLVHLRVGVYGEFSVRYTVIPAALALPWAASGFLYLLDRLALARANPRTLRAAAVLLCFAPLIIYLGRPLNRGKDHYRAAGEWLHDHAAPTDTILAHEHLEQLLFYAGRTYPDTTWIKCKRTDDLPAIRARIDQERPAWFVDARASHHGELDETPHFEALSKAPPPGMSLERSFGEPPHVYVFRATLKRSPSQTPKGAPTP